METIPFGNTGKEVTRIGLGGEGILRTYGRLREAEAVIQEAIDQGITYFDSARVYSDSEVYYGSIWKKNKTLRKSVFQTSKSASRDKASALIDLHNSLQRLHTDYLDLWQLHDIRTEEDLHAVSRSGGSLEAFVEAKEKGLVRNIGVTGHHDPYILTRAVEEWPVDSVLMPVNPVEDALGGFLTMTLPAARKKKIAAVGMKVMGGSHYILPKLKITPDILTRYALSFDITLPIVGCSTPEEVRSLAAASQLAPLTSTEKEKIYEIFRPYASQMAFYRGAR